MIPEALVPVVKAVRGLYTIDEKPLHTAISGRSVSPKVTFNGNHYLGPADFATIYDLPSSLTGTGVAIGIVGRSRTDFADFANFRTVTGSTFRIPTRLSRPRMEGVDPGPALTSPPGPGVSDDDQLEATLDVTACGQRRSRRQAFAGGGHDASGGIGVDAQYLIDTEPVPAQVMNVSFGRCESAAGPSGVAFWDTLFQQAAGEGISVFVSSRATPAPPVATPTLVRRLRAPPPTVRITYVPPAMPPASEEPSSMTPANRPSTGARATATASPQP